MHFVAVETTRICQPRKRSGILVAFPVVVLHCVVVWSLSDTYYLLCIPSYLTKVLLLNDAPQSRYEFLIAEILQLILFRFCLSIRIYIPVTVVLCNTVHSQMKHLLFSLLAAILGIFKLYFKRFHVEIFVVIQIQSSDSFV